PLTKPHLSPGPGPGRTGAVLPRADRPGPGRRAPPDRSLLQFPAGGPHPTHARAGPRGSGTPRRLAAHNPQPGARGDARRGGSPGVVLAPVPGGARPWRRVVLPPTVRAGGHRQRRAARPVCPGPDVVVEWQDLLAPTEPKRIGRPLRLSQPPRGV